VEALIKSGWGSSFKECAMQGGLVTVVNFLSVCLLASNAPATSAGTPAEGAFYQELEPGAYMRRWLVCGPFPVSEGSTGPVEEEVQRQAFYRDYLVQHGGEENIEPNVQMVHQYEGKEYRWQRAVSEAPIIDLAEYCGGQGYAVAYAWAEFDMPAAKRALLGVASGGPVRAWLNGEAIHENWESRSLTPDTDLLFVRFRAGRNRLLLKIQNRGGSWGFACRPLDAKTLGEKLLTAVADGEWGMVQMCLTFGADANAKDKYGFTALHIARMRGQKEIADLLLQKGADPNAPIPAGGTPTEFVDTLWNALKENYPMLEYAGAFNEDWYEQCKNQIKDIKSLEETLPIMDSLLVRRLNDYHTSLSWGARPDRAGPPLRVTLAEEQIVVTQCPPDLGVACGDIVLEIDGIPAKERFDQEVPRAFGATWYARADSACGAILEGRPGSEIKLKLRNARDEVYEKVLTRGGGGVGSEPEPVLSTRVLSDRIGYIRIRAWGRFAPAEFDKLLEPLRDKPGLVLDVRDNGGGSDRLAEMVIGRFITQPVVASISFQRRAGTNLYEKLVFTVAPRGPWRYDGRVAVLTNAGCASACEHFVSGMLEAGALLVGTPTTGACGWSKEIALPGGARLRCALTFPLHGKVPSPLHGIEPHYLVTPTIADLRAGRDTILEKALALLNTPSARPAGPPPGTTEP
jgi:carboxyl-terminal processing protease